MLTLRFEVEDAVVVAAPPAQAYELLADIPDSAAHFPQVEAVEPEPEGAWTWRLERIGVGKVSLQTVYALRYRGDPAAGHLRWEPVEGVGNAVAGGAWELEALGAGTRLKFQNRLEVSFRGLPSVLRRGIEPLALQENRRLVRAYLENLKRTLDGGNGRLR